MQKGDEMSNYPDHGERLTRLEQKVLIIQEKLDEIIQMIKNLEERVEPAITAQRLRDEWYGTG